MTLPGWLEPLPDAERMRATDAWAIEERGVPSLDLMERAGAGLTAVVERHAPRGPVAVVCGKGNNGGDGLVTARHLRERGREVRVLLAGDAGEFRGDARVNLERLPGPPPVPFEAGALEGAVAVVDALLGTGFAGEAREPLRSIIEALDDSRAPVIAADVPSGVDASSGEVHGPAVRAVATATFHAGKPGLWVHPGKDHAGQVEVVEIGIPPGAPAEARLGLIGPEVLAGMPRRHTGSTKFSSGQVIVAGGSPGLTGAPCLAAEAAQRTGAGYVTACVPASLEAIFELRLLEAMTVALPEEDGAAAPEAVDRVLELCEKGGALVLGPGAGRAQRQQAFLREVAARAPVPLLLDADGLNAHAERLEHLARREAPTVLTPHAGELGRLLGVESSSIGARRLHHARAAAERAGAILVLKGDDTVVAAPPAGDGEPGPVGVSRGGVGALATAGTGDVLSGVIGALLAKGMDAFTAACAGVWVHARAGAGAAGRIGPDSVIARDVIEALPGALAPT
jgi:ADP-dependent NAD(P)H-hydrate dehydratase / NAD(P)H-hydrate epimerase